MAARLQNSPAAAAVQTQGSKLEEVGTFGKCLAEGDVFSRMRRLNSG